MKTPIIIAALSAAVMGVACLSSTASLAQTPEQSAKAKATPQAPSEKIAPGTEAQEHRPAQVRQFSTDRTGTDTTSGKAELLRPSAKQ